MFNVGLVLFLGAGSSGCYENIGNVSRNVVVCEGIPETGHTINFSFLHRGSCS